MTNQQAKDLANHIGEVLCIEDVVSEIVEAVANDLSPADVFAEEQLVAWAQENGFRSNDLS